MLLPVSSTYGSESRSEADLTSKFSVLSWCCFAAAQILTGAWLGLALGHSSSPGVDEVVFQESLAHSPVVGLLLQGAVRLKHALL